MMDDMQVYIANLGKYNEGELVGDWFSFPLDEEVIAERMLAPMERRMPISFVRSSTEI